MKTPRWCAVLGLSAMLAAPAMAQGGNPAPPKERDTPATVRGGNVPVRNTTVNLRESPPAPATEPDSIPGEALRGGTYNSAKSNAATLIIADFGGQVGIGHPSYSLGGVHWALYELMEERWAILCGSTHGYVFAGDEDEAVEAAEVLCAAAGGRPTPALSLRPASQHLGRDQSGNLVRREIGIQEEGVN
jgi:hypothetical protein